MHPYKYNISIGYGRDVYRRSMNAVCGNDDCWFYSLDFRASAAVAFARPRCNISQRNGSPSSDRLLQISFKSRFKCLAVAVVSLYWQNKLE